MPSVCEARTPGGEDGQDRRSGARRAHASGAGPGDLAPTPEVRAERERARFRLHLVRHRSALKNRIHAILIAFGRACPMSDLFGVAGRELLDSLALPEPWQTNLVESLALVDDLTARIDALELELRRLGAEHPRCGCS